MNALALWIPGTLLLVIGALLLVLGRLDLAIALVGDWSGNRTRNRRHAALDTPAQATRPLVRPVIEA